MKVIQVVDGVYGKRTLLLGDRRPIEIGEPYVWFAFEKYYYSPSRLTPCPLKLAVKYDMRQVIMFIK